MSDDNTVHSDETEITSITDAYGEPIEYTGHKRVQKPPLRL